MLHDVKDAWNSTKRQRKDVGSLLIEQISTIVGPRLAVTMERERPWASITFSGTRHSIAISGLAQGNNDLPPLFAERLTDHAFEIPERFVADVLVSGRDTGSDPIMLEILTIIDPIALPGTSA